MVIIIVKVQVMLLLYALYACKLNYILLGHCITITLQLVAIGFQADPGKFFLFLLVVFFQNLAVSV